MTKSTLTANASLRELFAGIALQDGSEVPDITVTDISASSTGVVAGGLFIACRGYTQHGLEYLDASLAAGAAVVAWEPEPGLAEPVFPPPVIGLCVPQLGSYVGAIADRYFGAPSQAMSITGITGTNGKTTTAWLAANALITLGERSGYMGTLGFGIGTQLEMSALTTPGCIAVHRRLRKLADAGANSVVLEVSSHGLDQGRIDGINLRTAAFTNLSRDHLDYHVSLDAYQAAKAKLFDAAGIESAVINIGDPFGAALARNRIGAYQLITVALAGCAPDDQPAALTAELLDARADGLRVRFTGDYGSAEINSPLWGRFNVENLLVAAGILLASGYELDAAVRALETTPAPPGRMQIVRGSESMPLVVVDFAHTPDALAKVLSALRAHCDGQVFAVFGCGGNRDSGKRSQMGTIAALHADHVIVTDDNPRDEDPVRIVEEILAGVNAADAVEVVHDRALAIQRAIEAATPQDAVLIAGKGSECFQYIGADKQSFSDVEVAARIMGVAA